MTANMTLNKEYQTIDIFIIKLCFECQCYTFIFFPCIFCKNYYSLCHESWRGRSFRDGLADSASLPGWRSLCRSLACLLDLNWGYFCLPWHSLLYLTLCYLFKSALLVSKCGYSYNCSFLWLFISLLPTNYGNIFQD